MKKIWPELKPYLILIPASIVYAIAFNWCFQPNGIAYGGVTGIAQMIHYYVPTIPIGGIIIAMNVPIFAIGWRFLSRKLAILSAYTMVLTSVMIDLVAMVYTFQPMEPLLACIYGGGILGVGVGVIALQEASTGGTDLGARLIKLAVPWLPVGKVMLALDLTVIISVALAFQQLNSALYGMVALYISTLVVDTILYGMDKSQLAYIISIKHEELAQAITQNLSRGVTLLEGRGGFTGNEKQVILCAFKQRQIVRVKQLVKSVDPDAFIILCPAHEVMGQGFRMGDTVGY